MTAALVSGLDAANSPENHRALYARARAASQRWGQQSLRNRAARLRRLLGELDRRADELAELIADENGKPNVEAIAHEVLPSVSHVRWLCEHGPRILAPSPRALPWMPVRTAHVHRRAHGVVLVISPWNLPLAIPFSQVTAALLGGNAVVLKPSEVTPRVGAAIAELLAVCDLPADLFTLVQGDGGTGAALIDARPDKVFFTGSVPTGRRVMAAASAHPIPVSLELGGVDALLVLEDADLELASSAAAWGATCNTGQVCASVERVLVHRSVADEFRQRLEDKLDRIGPSDLGRATLDRQADVWRAHLADAQKRDLAVHGGSWLRAGTLSPTLVSGEGTRESAVWNEESFGPLVALLPFDDDDEAVALHDSTPYGLTASVFSADVPRATALAGRLRCGLVSVNDVGATLYGHAELPWGGVGDSGFGRSHGEEGLLETTWTQVVERGRIAEIKKPWWYPYGPEQRRMFRQYVRAVATDHLPTRARALARLSGHAARLFSEAPRW